MNRLSTHCLIAFIYALTLGCSFSQSTQSEEYKLLVGKWKVKGSERSFTLTTNGLLVDDFCMQIQGKWQYRSPLLTLSMEPSMKSQFTSTLSFQLLPDKDPVIDGYRMKWLTVLDNVAITSSLKKKAYTCLSENSSTPPQVIEEKNFPLLQVTTDVNRRLFKFSVTSDSPEISYQVLKAYKKAFLNYVKDTFDESLFKSLFILEDINFPVNDTFAWFGDSDTLMGEIIFAGKFIKIQTNNGKEIVWIRAE